MGRDKETLSHFETVIEAGSFMMDVHQRAHAFRLRIQKDPDWFKRMNPEVLTDPDHGNGSRGD